MMADYKISVAYDAPSETVVLRVFDGDLHDGNKIVARCNVGENLEADALYEAWHEFCADDDPSIYSELALDRQEPMIEGRRISIRDIVEISARDDPWQIFDDWDLSSEQITQALQYYLDCPAHVGQVSEVGNDEIRSIIRNTE